MKQYPILTLEEYERLIILKVCRKRTYDRAQKVAETLGIGLRSAYRKIKEHCETCPHCKGSGISVKPATKHEES